MTTAPPPNTQGIRADKLVSLPSLSSSLYSLPQATSLANVSLHPSMYAQRAAESEAKVTLSRSLPWCNLLTQLKKVLSKTAASQPQTPPPPAIPAYMNPFDGSCLNGSAIRATSLRVRSLFIQPPSNPNMPNTSTPLMMRKSQKPKFQA
ncbi:hypothetical protein V8B97DRAFT_1914113 [Scleroderma yunnanense]